MGNRYFYDFKISNYRWLTKRGDELLSTVKASTSSSWHFHAPWRVIMRGMDVLNFANWFVRELWPPRESLPGITIAEVVEIKRGLGKTEIFFFQKCLFTGMGWRLDEYWCSCGSFGSAERTRLNQLCISNPHARHTTLLASRRGEKSSHQSPQVPFRWF